MHDWARRHRLQEETCLQGYACDNQLYGTAAAHTNADQNGLTSRKSRPVGRKSRTNNLAGERQKCQRCDETWHLAYATEIEVETDRYEENRRQKAPGQARHLLLDAFVDILSSSTTFG